MVSRWRMVALLAGAMAVGVVMVGSPAGAHVGGTVTHLWNHLKPKADARYVNESELKWAVVNADGTLARGSNAVSVATSGVGNYIVRFNTNVRNCAYNATIGLSGASGTSAPGFITVVGAAVDVNGVFVTTDDIAGVSATRGFHLIVDCATTSAPALARVRSGGGPDNQG